MNTRASMDGISMAFVAFIAIIVFVIIAIVVYVTTMRAQPSAANLAALVAAATSQLTMYPNHMAGRKSLYDYLQTMGAISGDYLATSNFYVMTANLGGFFSPVNQAAFSTDAITYALQAGARCIIFDVWPDNSKGANFGPILKVCANDKSIEKLSYYTLDINLALAAVQKEAFGNSANPANNDPLYLFFRFRGKPVTNTYTGTANAISLALEQYRLPFVYTSTSNNSLYSTPINELFGKVIILSNKTGILPNGTRTSFADYVNNPISYVGQPLPNAISTPGDVRGVSSDQLTPLQSTESKHMILACAPLPEDTDNSESNAWDWKGAMNAGIQLVGLNLWVQDSGLTAYLDPAMFGTYSFMMKPNTSTPTGIDLRYSIEYVPPPTPVANLGYGNGTMTVT